MFYLSKIPHPLKCTIPCLSTFPRFTFNLLLLRLATKTLCLQPFENSIWIECHIRKRTFPFREVEARERGNEKRIVLVFCTVKPSCRKWNSTLFTKLFHFDTHFCMCISTEYKDDMKIHDGKSSCRDGRSMNRICVHDSLAYLSQRG